VDERIKKIWYINLKNGMLVIKTKEILPIFDNVDGP